MPAEHPTREEVRELIKDKLEAVELRLENKLIGLDAKIDRLTDAVVASRTELKEVKADNKYTRWTIVTTIVLGVIAAVAVIITVQIGLLTAFSSGAAEHVKDRSPPSLESAPKTP